MPRTERRYDNYILLKSFEDLGPLREGTFALGKIDRITLKQGKEKWQDPINKRNLSGVYAPDVVTADFEDENIVIIGRSMNSITRFMCNALVTGVDKGGRNVPNKPNALIVADPNEFPSIQSEKIKFISPGDLRLPSVLGYFEKQQFSRDKKLLLIIPDIIDMFTKIQRANRVIVTDTLGRILAARNKSRSNNSQILSLIGQVTTQSFTSTDFPLIGPSFSDYLLLPGNVPGNEDRQSEMQLRQQVSNIQRYSQSQTIRYVRFSELEYEAGYFGVYGAGDSMDNPRFVMRVG